MTVSDKRLTAGARPPKTLTSPSLTLFVTALERQGVKLEAVKARHGVRGSPLRVPLDGAEAFIRACIEESGDPLVHAKVALGLPRGAWGAAEFLWRSAPTLQHAFEAFQRSAPLISEVLSVSLREHRGGHRLALHTGVGACSDEFTALSTLRTLKEMVGASDGGLGVGFTHSAPPYAAALAKLAGVPLSFDEAELWLSLGPGVLGRENRLADPALFRALDELFSAVAAKLTRPRSFLAEVEAAVAERLADAAIDLALVAQSLGLTPRTLQRRLDAEATTFKRLLDRVRRRTAEELLASLDVPLDDIAFRLGFSEFSAFARAYKRWSGQSPGAARTAYVRRERNSGPRQRVQPH